MKMNRNQFIVEVEHRDWCGRLSKELITLDRLNKVVTKIDVTKPGSEGLAPYLFDFGELMAEVTHILEECNVFTVYSVRLVNCLGPQPLEYGYDPKELLWNAYKFIGLA